MINFDERTEEEKLKDKIYFDSLEDYACELIHYCRKKSRNDINKWIKNITKLINSKTSHNNPKTQSAKRVDKINKNFHRTFKKGQEQFRKIGKLL